MEEDFLSVGLLNYIDNNYKTALENFNKVVNKNDENHEALLYRGICHLKLGNYENSINDLNKSEALSGESSFSYSYNRGLAYLYNNEISNAKQDLESAKKCANDEQLALVEKVLKKL